MLYKKWFGLAMGLAALLLATGTASAFEVGLTIDVHQDVPCDPQNPNTPCPNDFHIEGLLCSPSGPPVLLNHIDGPFAPPAGTFSYSITWVGPDPCYYWFVADWSLVDPMAPGISYCTVIHLGLVFDADKNLAGNLHSWWTYNGQRIGQIHGDLLNQGSAPVVSFEVTDADPQVVRIVNGNMFPVTPQPVPPPGIPIEIVDMDLMVFPSWQKPNIEDLREGGPLTGWIPVAAANGVPIKDGPPVAMMPDSFFDVFLEIGVEPLPPDAFAPVTPVHIESGGFLVARTLIAFTNNNGVREERWQWVYHEGETQPPEACCLPDGTCADILPADCLQQGGIPQGPGTDCATTVCPQPEVGACCIDNPDGPPFCVVVDAITCDQQLLGHWKGPGTDCSDLNGNQVADACEPSPIPEACCMPDGRCSMETVESCRLQGGTPAGAGVMCSGDLNGNGIDETCEHLVGPLKFIQPPDLNMTGIDVNATEPLVLADDFLCTKRTAVTDITIWGSWKDEIEPDYLRAGNVVFTLSIHADIPAGPQSYSRPGHVLWVKTFQPGTYLVNVERQDINEWWMDPSVNLAYYPGDHVCWRYDFKIPVMEAFCQQGSPEAPIVYWLDVQARQIEPTNSAFGWKTSYHHWNDAAVWGQGVEPFIGPWNKLVYPPNHIWSGANIDMAFSIGGDEPCVELDWGDAPDQPYPTLNASNGARHVIMPGMMLGNLIDAESDGQPNANATGDDIANLPDEDGVLFLSPLARGQVCNVRVIASLPGMLDAWVDFNGINGWTDPGEQVFLSVPLAAGSNVLSFVVPPNARSGPTFARFRYSSLGGLPYFGLANDGEVEDYMVTIPSPTIVARRVFYNNSYYDGNKPGIDPVPGPGARDDDADAIDPFKSPLMTSVPPTNVATFTNWTGFAQGINGLIYDIQDQDPNLPPPSPIDFTFRDIGRAGTSPGVIVIPNGFTTYQLSVVPNVLRCVMTFPSIGGATPSGSVQNTWLQVDIGTGFGAVAERHYWGNARMESNTISGVNILVTAADEIDARNNPHSIANRALVDDWYDYNKDSLVSSADQILARNNKTTIANCVKVITR